MSCETVKKEAYATHPGCYTNHDKSFCFLPIKDIALILTRVLNLKDMIKEEVGRKQLIETAKICIKQVSEKEKSSSLRLKFWKDFKRAL